MATRAAIAAKDRAQRERESKREYDMRGKELKQKYSKQQMDHVTNSASAAGSILKGISRWNEPEWYKKFNVTEAMAKIPTFFRTGVPLKTGWLYSHSAGTGTVADNLPGVMTFVYHPTLPNNFPSAVIGNTYYRSSSMNSTLTRFMAELRKLNSRIGDYDPSDIGFYMYALSDVMEDILHLVKAIKLYNTWYAENANYTRVVLKAAGFDPDDFIANYNAYKAFAIKAIQQFNSSAVLPKSLTFLQRRAWLSSVVIRDHDSKTAQIYMFRKGASVTLSEDETALAIVRDTGSHIYNVFTNSVNGKMQDIFNSVGMVTITADLRAAFKQEDLLQIPDLDIGSPILYSDSLTDLEQVHNLNTLPCVFSRWMKKNVEPAYCANANINQDSDGYLYQGRLSGGVIQPLSFDFVTAPSASELAAYTKALCVRNNTKFLNFYKSDEINEDDIIEGTRLRCVLSEVGDGSVTHGFSVVEYCGTEIIMYGQTWIYDIDNSSIDFYGFTTDIISGQFELLNEDTKAMVGRFDWLPVYRHSTYDGTNYYYNTFGEIDHPVILADDNLRWLHEGCAFSEFFIESQSFGYVKH